MFNQLRMPSEWSTMKKLIWLRGNPATGQQGTDLTVSGTPPLSLPNSLGKPLESWSVELSPYQDLHGYDNPWPAGGGANKFDALTWITLGANSSNYSVASDETITVLQSDEGGISNRLFSLTAGETYSVLTTGDIATIRVFDSTSTTLASGGSNVSFTVPTDGKIAVKFTAGSYPSSGKCSIVRGSTAPSTWTPFSNICPIHGTDKLTITTSGKNLYNMALQQTTSSNSYYGFAPINNTDYTFSIGTAATGIYANYSDAESMPEINSNNWTGLAVRYSSNTVSFNSGIHKWIQLITYVNSGLVSTTYQLEFGSTASAYTPYIAPSQTVIDVPTLSANKWDEEWELGDISGTSGQYVDNVYKYILSKNPIPVNPDTEYCITSTHDTGTSTRRWVVYYYDTNGDFIDYVSLSNIASTFTTPQNCGYIKFRTNNNSGTQTYEHDISVNYPSTVTTYNPYNATVYTATIGSEGGESRWGEVDLGTLNWNASTPENSIFRSNSLQGRILCPINGNTPTSAICEQFTAMAWTPISGSDNGKFSVANIGSSSEGLVVFIDHRYTSTSDFINAVTGVKLVFPLLTPQAFTLTTPDIPTPNGNATAWAVAEDGIVDSMEVTYVGKA